LINTLNALKMILRSSCKKKIEDKMKETDDKLVKAVESKVEGHLDAVTSNIVAVKSDVNEQKERELRASNIIIYNVPEVNAESLQQKIKADQEFCLDTFNKVLRIKISVEDMKRSVRLGKRAESGPRPLLIQFRDRVLKNMIMESLSALKDAGD